MMTANIDIVSKGNVATIQNNLTGSTATVNEPNVNNTADVLQGDSWLATAPNIPFVQGDRYTGKCEKAVREWLHANRSRRIITLRSLPSGFHAPSASRPPGFSPPPCDTGFANAPSPYVYSGKSHQRFRGCSCLAPHGPAFAVHGS